MKSFIRVLFVLCLAVCASQRLHAEESKQKFLSETPPVAHFTCRSDSELNLGEITYKREICGAKLQEGGGTPEYEDGFNRITLQGRKGEKKIFYNVQGADYVEATGNAGLVEFKSGRSYLLLKEAIGHGSSGGADYHVALVDLSKAGWPLAGQVSFEGYDDYLFQEDADLAHSAYIRDMDGDGMRDILTNELVCYKSNGFQHKCGTVYSLRTGKLVKIKSWRE